MVVAGFFSFHKLSMFVDLDPKLWSGSSALDESSLASKLISGSNDRIGDGLYAPDYQIDEHPVAQTIELPLDADSSQLSALSDIADGKSLVIEGPPGTGKSQTIANAIANAMEQGKTVLFVAEKLAALEVVHKRLTQAGLADFCLELHGHAVSPKKVYESLANRLASSQAAPPTNAQERTHHQTYRSKLHAYLRASSGMPAKGSCERQDRSQAANRDLPSRSQSPRSWSPMGSKRYFKLGWRAISSTSEFADAREIARICWGSNAMGRLTTRRDRHAIAIDCGRRLSKVADGTCIAFGRPIGF
jgi:hypothetical protein